MDKDYYPIICDIHDEESDIEHLGTKEKFWFMHNEAQHLLKYSKGDTGEHWAEKCAASFCELLQLPHASYDLAYHNNKWAVISKKFLPSDEYALIIGNELLQEVDSSYPAYPEQVSDKDQIVRVKEHTVERVISLLNNGSINPPMADGVVTMDPSLSAADYYCGYLMLDALISNQDRHHENWAVLTCKNTKFLAPTFDHAASLGRELLDEERNKRLDTKDNGYKVASFVKKARSELFEYATDTKPLLTVDAFLIACKQNKQSIQSYWIDRLRKIKQEDIQNIFERLPPTCISEPAKSFAIQVVIENQNRLLNYV